MIEKYKTVKQDIFEYIHNRTKAGVSPETIVVEVENRFPAFIAFFKCEPDMLAEFMQWLAEQAYYHVNRTYYEKSVFKRVDPGAAVPDGDEADIPASVED